MPRRSRREKDFERYERERAYERYREDRAYNKRKKSYLILKIILAVLVVVLVKSATTKDKKDSNTTITSTVSQSASTTKTATAKPTQKPTPAPTPEPSTPEEWVQAYIDKKLPSQHWYYEYVEDADGGPWITIYYDMPDRKTNADRKSAFLWNAQPVMQYLTELRADGKIEFSIARFVGIIDVIDAYGNESKAHGMELIMEASELEKINWKNFQSEMFEAIGSIGTHRLLRDN